MVRFVRRQHGNVLAVLTALWLCVCPAAKAMADSFQFDIAAQSMPQALKRFAAQAHVQLLFDYKAVEALKTPAIKGRLEATDALGILLRGSGLTFQQVNDHTIAISRALPTSDAQQQPGPESVAKNGGGETAQDLRLAQADQVPTGTKTKEQDKDKKDQKSEELQEVVVTGTHIHGVTNLGAPTLTISRDEIDQSGYSTVQQVVSTLPQNFNGATPLGSGGAGTSVIASQNGNEATAIDLRGLGPQSTLTLIDGQRVAANVQGRVVDISMIPLAMVDHIDVVTGGSSAIYGTDAVGGVANIVLRHSYEGAETSASFGDGQYGGDRLEFDQVAGHQFDWGGFIFGYEYSRDSALNLVKTGFVQPISSVSNTQFGELSYEEPAADWQNSVNLGGQFKPGDRVEIYAEASYSHKKLYSFTSQIFPPVSGDYNYQNVSNGSTTQYGATLGSRIRLPASWGVDLSATSSVLSFPDDQSALAGTPGAMVLTDTYRNERSGMDSVSLVADGTLVTIGGRDIKMALGGEFRRETFSASANLNINNAARDVSSGFAELHIPLANSPSNKYSGYYNLEVSAAARYDHYSDFGGTFNPQFGLVWSPVADLSIRGTYARAFRAPELFITSTPALSALGLLPISSPSNPAGTNYPALILSGGNPNVGPETARTWTAGLDYKLPWESATTKITASYFNIDYRDRLNIAFIEPPPFNTAQFPSSILNLNPTTPQIVSDMSVAPFSGNFVPGSTWNGNPLSLLAEVPGVALVDARYNNISSEVVRGLDLILSSKVDTGAGRGDFSINATRTFSHHFNITPEVAAIEAFNQVGQPAATKIRASAGWTRGAVGGFAFVNYVGSYTNQFTVPTTSISSWTTVDLTLIFDSTHYWTQGILSNIKISLAAQNVLDRGPPRFEENPIGLLFDPANANPLGRIWSIRASKKW